MRKLKITKIIASTLVLASALVLNPIGVNAEWRQTNSGDWWYADQYGGWLIDWQEIDGKYYYFYGENGLMAHDTTISTQSGDFTLGSDGAWVHEKFGGRGIYNMPPLTHTVFNFNFDTGIICRYQGNATEIIIPAEIEGKKVNRITTNAFYGNTNTKKIVITDGIADIGSYAFDNCPNLEAVYVPDSIQSIGLGAFDHSFNAKFYVKSERVKKLLTDGAYVPEETIIIQK